ncbi:6-pyruvoyl tetrahydropterin synthase family protein [Candidatus Uabimicrobium sp. HlEnr_7]|uniref:6-pyruvoyl trahydropterin synthase family protein n=1 Tax=Candidatus Uabimicrobium helgolandensis TaxID=3095367 RepID=UPI003558789A
MFSVGVREHILIAHSLKGDIFGPAQNMHGCTYVVDVEFIAEKLDENGIVIDMGIAGQIVKDVLQEINYQNLDEIEKFKGKNTTTEFLAQHIFKQVGDKLNDSLVTSLKVTLNESHTAWASFSGNV